MCAFGRRNSGGHMMKGWNTMSEKGTSLAQYVEHFGLEILNHGDTYETDKVESTNVNRPDLQILGLFDYFDARRIQENEREPADQGF